MCSIEFFSTRRPPSTSSTRSNWTRRSTYPASKASRRIFLKFTDAQADADFTAEVQRLIAWVKSSEKASPGGEILMPGEIEERTKAQRLREGIELDETTWGQLISVGKLMGVSMDSV